jgi:hypothetical protein
VILPITVGAVEPSDFNGAWLFMKDDKRVETRGMQPRSKAEMLSQALRPLTNTILVKRHFASIDELEDAQAARCVALQARPDLVRSATLFHWWPQRLHKRHVPRRK